MTALIVLVLAIFIMRKVMRKFTHSDPWPSEAFKFTSHRKKTPLESRRKSNREPVMRNWIKRKVCETWHVHDWKGLWTDSTVTCMRCPKCPRIWLAEPIDVKWPDQPNKAQLKVAEEAFTISRKADAAKLVKLADESYVVKLGSKPAWKD